MDTSEKGILASEETESAMRGSSEKAEGLSDGRDRGKDGDVEAGRESGECEIPLIWGLYRWAFANFSRFLDAVPVVGENDVPPLKGLSLLDRFLVVWIVLAMAIGILLGNFVDSVGPELQKGKFVGVSVPIGEFEIRVRVMMYLLSSLPFGSCVFRCVWGLTNNNQPSDSL